MDGTLPKISFLKLQGRVAPITPWGWMGVDGMDLVDHNITQNIHIKLFLMKGQIFFLSSVELLEHGHFLMDFSCLK